MTHAKDEALKLALEALLINCGGNTEGIGKEAITAIKQALAAPVQEPVAWQYRDANDDGTWSAWLGCDKRLTESTWREVRPLYITPPAAPVQEPWKERFIWLVSQHWVEPEATFRLGLEETDDSCNYERQIIDSIDKAASINTAPNVATPLAAPAPEERKRQWTGLTDEEMYLNCPNWLSQEQCKVWIQQIEAKLKERNV